jgi:hypothetical protein
MYANLGKEILMRVRIAKFGNYLEQKRFNKNYSLWRTVIINITWYNIQ